MSVTFLLRPHATRPDTSICEIWVDDKFVGALYPHEPNGVKLISSHLEGEEGLLQEFRFEP